VSSCRLTVGQTPQGDKPKVKVKVHLERESQTFNLETASQSRLEKFQRRTIVHSSRGSVSSRGASAHPFATLLSSSSDLPPSLVLQVFNLQDFCSSLAGLVPKPHVGVPS
jgi:hypothetical protein